MVAKGLERAVHWCLRLQQAAEQEGPPPPFTCSTTSAPHG